VARVDLGGLKVLVASDDAFGVNVLRVALHLADIRDITVARDSESAMKLLRSEDFAALFCDGDQPDVDDMPFTVAVRRTEGVRNPSMPIFLVSAAPRQRVVSGARDLGVNAVLAKPISAASIVRKLSMAINAPRSLIATSDYFGPDRRFRDKRRGDGPRRRKSDREIAGVVLVQP
jgi:two-component system, chemotaxis family, chemotaxis protein CheY